MLALLMFRGRNKKEEEDEEEEDDDDENEDNYNNVFDSKQIRDRRIKDGAVIR